MQFMVWVLVLLALHALPCSSASVKMCYLFPSPPADLGFTYTTRASADVVKKMMEAKYPNTTVTNLILINQLAAPNITATLVDLATTAKCNTVMVCSRNLIDFKIPGGAASFFRIATMFPTVVFWVLSAPIAAMPASNKPLNVIGVTGHPGPSWFAAGAAAAIECRSCISIAVPSVAQRFVANSFFEGLKFGEKFKEGANISRNCPVLAFELGGFSVPPSERAFAQTMLKRGCSVLVVFADSYEASKTLQQQHRAYPNVFSVAGNVNGALVVGDTVLASVYFSLLESFERVAESTILGVLPEHGLHQPTVLGEMSPLALHSAVVAMQQAREAVNANISVLLCAPDLLFPDGSCYQNVSHFVSMTSLNRRISMMGLFPSPLQCGPGTYCNYNISGNMKLQCSMCPPNTFTAAPGLFTCSPCPEGLVSEQNASVCFVPVPSASTESMPLCVVLVLAIVIPAVVIIAAVLIYLNFGHHKAEIAAPRVSPLAFVIIDVDSDRSSKGWRKKIRGAALIFSLLRESVLHAARVNKAYVVYASPTTFLVAAPSVKQVYQVAEDVEHHLRDANTDGVVLATRSVIHFGEALFIRGRKESSRSQYVGPALDVLLDLNKAQQARVGQMSITAAAFKILKESDPTVEARTTNVFKLRAGAMDEFMCYRILFSDGSKGVGAQVEQKDPREGDPRVNSDAPPQQDHQPSPKLSDNCTPRGAKSSSSNNVFSAENSVSVISMIIRSQRLQLFDICTSTLQMFLGVVNPDVQQRFSKILQQRFRITPPQHTKDPNEVTKYICANISPGLVSTMDEVHLREVMRTINRPDAGDTSSANAFHRGQPARRRVSAVVKK